MCQARSATIKLALRARTIACARQKSVLYIFLSVGSNPAWSGAAGEGIKNAPSGVCTQPETRAERRSIFYLDSL
jgi:hypothetical protein